MQKLKYKSRDRLPQIVEWQGLRRPLSTEDFKERSVLKTEGCSPYNPLTDPYVRVYLGKSHLKTKLQQMGYVLNPESNEVLRKEVSKKKRGAPLTNSKVGGKTMAAQSRRAALESISKAEFDSYLKGIKDRISTN